MSCQVPQYWRVLQHSMVQATWACIGAAAALHHMSLSRLPTLNASRTGLERCPSAKPLLCRFYVPECFSTPVSIEKGDMQPWTQHLPRRHPAIASWQVVQVGGLRTKLSAVRASRMNDAQRVTELMLRTGHDGQCSFLAPAQAACVAGHEDTCGKGGALTDPRAQIRCSRSTLS